MLHDNKLVSFPLTSEASGKVESLLASINDLHFGQAIYLTTEEKLVAYLFFLIKNHPFTDGNKRTACLTFLVMCDVNGIIPHYNGFTLDQMAVFIEKVTDSDHQRVIRRLAEVLYVSFG